MPSPLRMKRVLFGVTMAFSVVLYVVYRHINIISDHLNAAADRMPSWLSNLAGAAYGAKYCSTLRSWSKDSKYPPVQAVASELGLKDGESLFVNGLRCGHWLLALQETFPRIKLYGVDSHPHFVEYVKTIVNGSFAVAEPWDLTGLSFKDSLGRTVGAFDRALVDGILSFYDADLQCASIRGMVPLVKPGGSLFIGGNFESCAGSEHLVDLEGRGKKPRGVTLLPQCYWPQHCLHKRHDISEIIYMNDSYLMPDLAERDGSPIEHETRPSIAKCAASVFVFKNILLLDRHNRDPLRPESRYVHRKHAHKCTMAPPGVQPPHWLPFSKDSIKNAVREIKEKGMDMR